MEEEKSREWIPEKDRERDVSESRTGPAVVGGGRGGGGRGGFNGHVNKSFDDDLDSESTHHHHHHPQHQHHDDDPPPYRSKLRDVQGHLDVSTDSVPPYSPPQAADPRSAPSPSLSPQDYIARGSDAYRSSEGGEFVTGDEGDFVAVDLNTSPVMNGDGGDDGVDDSLDSVVLEERHGWRGQGYYGGSGGGGWESPYLGGGHGGPVGVENEAYDGDAETDLSYSHPPTGPGLDPPVLRNPDPNPFPVLDRPVSGGRYHKNPSMERTKAPVAPGPYDPNIGVFLAPPLANKRT